MKKIALLLIALVGVLSMQAEDAYSYLTFETTDGTKASVSIEGLTLAINGTTLTTGGHQFTLTNLSKMYFSTSDESTMTGIDAVSDSSIDEATEIYDLNGRKIEKGKVSDGKLPCGVYIVKTKSKTYKIVVK